MILDGNEDMHPVLPRFETARRFTFSQNAAPIRNVPLQLALRKLHNMSLHYSQDEVCSTYVSLSLQRRRGPLHLLQCNVS